MQALNQEAVYQYAARANVSMKVAEQRLRKEAEQQEKMLQKMFAKRVKK